MSKRNWNWCFDYLIVGFVIQNFVLLISGLDGRIELKRWYILFLIPLAIWGLEIIQSYISKTEVSDGE